MNIKGKSRAGARSLAAHLGNAEKNERVQLLATRGTVSQDLQGALVEMEAVASGTRCHKSLYHASISPQPPYRLSPEQRTAAVDALEKKLGLEGHARVVVLHEKLGREHMHVVWSRIDLGRMASVPDSHNYRKHEEVSRALEREFGHPHIQGAHAERQGPDGKKVPRPDRTPSRAELRQEERTGIKGKEVKAEVTAAFKGSDGPEAFRSALADRGYLLAQGDRRDFVVVDRAGGVHSLARRLDGMTAADLREFMSPLDRSGFPTADQAKAIQLERTADLGPQSQVDGHQRRGLTDEQRRKRAAYLEDRLEAAYGRGDDMVSQQQAAQRDFERRQERLDKTSAGDDLWNRIESGEAERDKLRKLEAAKSEGENRPEPSRSSSVEVGDVELTDAMQARLDRLRAAKEGAAPVRDGPGRQGPAPGGGRTRGR